MFFVMIGTIMLACTDQSDGIQQKNVSEAQSQEERKKLATTFSEQAHNETIKILQSSEKIRALFASDNIVGLETYCDEIISVSKQAEFAAPDNLKPRYTIISEMAKELKKAKQDDLETARQDFGYLSRVVIELLQQEPSLQKDLYIFECPMAQDYKKWIQKENTINNPYMGSKMLECGAPSSF